MPKFSLIVPVYNRPQEISDLLQSLENQKFRDFEAILVEDGSTVPCTSIIEKYPEANASYFYKPNEGRSIARNYGIERSTGDWLVFVDSDCVLPDDYFLNLANVIDRGALDCFGGPDAANDSFSPVQQAISFAMTSFLTTGGIRGGKVSMESFTPRSFNMGMTRKAYEKVGGFREMFSEDIDLSMRLRNAGMRIGLVREAPVFHKRRVSFAKFWRQVHVFGMSRITLKLLYPSSLKLVHTLPALAVIIGLALLVLGCVISPWFWLPLALYVVLLFVAALVSTKKPEIALLSVPAGIIQIAGYGTGFIRAYLYKIILGHGRDVAQEIAMRKGK